MSTMPTPAEIDAATDRRIHHRRVLAYSLVLAVLVTVPLSAAALAYLNSGASQALAAAGNYLSIAMAIVLVGMVTSTLWPPAAEILGLPSRADERTREIDSRSRSFAVGATLLVAVILHGATGDAGMPWVVYGGYALYFATSYWGNRRS